MIKIQVNDSFLEIRENTNIIQVLEQLKSPIDGVAIAINNTIIPRNLWDKMKFTNNDNVLIIQATQGG
ncbi:sulfur carrier protein ThiS [Snuella sedimenti]|uniref:Sulfur carrier protein ThiS n=1 Tax=Snuella sedimenti TaxID=2798802 RepID=A0A8J7LMZ5_9FLAO|nr:sulfur carrier protein ThiS [Snuella sedimenti]MBJ6368169.1 sulfur carrier protein ThiS [Snuella sedimenti]